MSDFLELIISGRLVAGHVFADGVTHPFVHLCPGAGCAVRAYLLAKDRDAREAERAVAIALAYAKDEK